MDKSTPIIVVQGHEKGRSVYYEEKAEDPIVKPRLIYTFKKSPANDQQKDGLAEKDGSLNNKRQRTGSGDDCMLCQDKLSPQVGTVDCDVCQNPACFPCTKLPEILQDMAKTGNLAKSGVTWMCNCCKAGLPRLTTISQTLQELKNGTETRLSALETRMGNFESKIDTAVQTKIDLAQPKMVEAIQNNIDTNIKDTILEEVRKTVKGELEKELQNKQIPTQIAPKGAAALSPGTQQKNIDLTMQEMREREEKMPNLILFNVKEAQTNVRDEISREDTKTFVDMCQVMRITMSQDKVMSARRLGEKKDDTDRPILIKLSNHSLKGNIFKNTGKLANTKYKDISIANDLTKMQREQNTKLRREAKQKEENDKSGKYGYKVVGPPWARKIKMVLKPIKEPVEMEVQEAAKAEAQEVAQGGAAAK